MKYLQMVLILPPMPRMVTVSVDGAQLGAYLSQGSDALGPPVRLKLRLPEPRSSTIRVLLELDRSWSPSAWDGGADTRELGVAVLDMRCA
jgi:hypothetical protein